MSVGASVPRQEGQTTKLATSAAAPVTLRPDAARRGCRASPDRPRLLFADDAAEHSEAACGRFDGEWRYLPRLTPARSRHFGSPQSGPRGPATASALGRYTPHIMCAPTALRPRRRA